MSKCYSVQFSFSARTRSLYKASHMERAKVSRSNAKGLMEDKKKPTNLSDQIYQVLSILFWINLWLAQTFYYVLESIYLMINRPVPKSVRGDIVLITGTGHGIGKQLALQYAEAGATVVGWDINENNNAETIKEINQRFKNKAHGFRCDVSNREDVLNVAKKVQNNVGVVTILIANAGIMPSHSISEHSPDEIRRIMDINVMQLFWLLEAFLPDMKKFNRGHIVGISSIAGLGGFTNLVPYCASKFAVRGLLESLYEELRTNHLNKIRTTIIYPFMVDTGLCKNPKLSFDLIMKMLPPQTVAKEAMMAQRTDVLEKSIPSYYLLLTNFVRLFPAKVAMKLVDYLDSGLGSDLVENNDE